MGEVYRTSDTHFDHDLVAGTRDFETGRAMSAHIMEVLSSTLKSGDVLYHHGDIAMEGSWRTGLNYLRSLPGTKHLLIGNHDRVFPQKRDAHRFFREYAEVFDSIQLFSRHKMDGVQYIAGHMPYWPNDRHEPRLRQWRPYDEGLPILHGHTHNTERHEWPGHMNLSWDAWGRPVTQGEVLDWLRDVA